MIPLLTLMELDDIKETLKFRLRDDLLLHLQDCKDLWLEIKSKESNFTLAVMYRTV